MGTLAVGMATTLYRSLFFFNVRVNFSMMSAQSRPCQRGRHGRVTGELTVCDQGVGGE